MWIVLTSLRSASRRACASRSRSTPHDFSQTDAHDRAVRDLIAAGLLRREGNSIVATRAAVHFYMLHG